MAGFHPNSRPLFNNLSSLSPLSTVLALGSWLLALGSWLLAFGFWASQPGRKELHNKILPCALSACAYVFSLILLSVSWLEQQMKFNVRGPDCRVNAGIRGRMCGWVWRCGKENTCLYRLGTPYRKHNGLNAGSSSPRILTTDFAITFYDNNERVAPSIFKADRDPSLRSG
jgi:hypothetical protein